MSIYLYICVCIYLSIYLSIYGINLYHVCQFRFHRVVFKPRNLEHVDISEHDHCSTCFSLHLWWLWTYRDYWRLKTNLNGVIAEMRARTFYSSTSHLEGERELKAHAKVTACSCWQQAQVSRFYRTLISQALFLQQLLGFCDFLQAWLLEMFLLF